MPSLTFIDTLVSKCGSVEDVVDTVIDATIIELEREITETRSAIVYARRMGGFDPTIARMHNRIVVMQLVLDRLVQAKDAKVPAC